MTKWKMNTTQLEEPAHGVIADKHVEWAIVNRLKAMLDGAADAVFRTVHRHSSLDQAGLGWAATRGTGPFNSAKRIMLRERRAQRCKPRISDPPWSLSKVRLRFGRAQERDRPRSRANQSRFQGHDHRALYQIAPSRSAHGDGGTITPIHKP
jgi:hypothetical protein